VAWPSPTREILYRAKRNAKDKKERATENFVFGLRPQERSRFLGLKLKYKLI
jgi:hypothetical protein